VRRYQLILLNLHLPCFYSQISDSLSSALNLFKKNKLIAPYTYWYTAVKKRFKLFLDQPTPRQTFFGLWLFTPSA
jgi:hypothetical protein